LNQEGYYKQELTPPSYIRNNIHQMIGGVYVYGLITQDPIEQAAYLKEDQLK
jgi:hypothetical protein